MQSLNLIVKFFYATKVGDFGLSRILFKNYSHVSTKTHGTITYMPPEMLHEGRLAPAVDVYSYGILLWEMFTGTIAFSGKFYLKTKLKSKEN